MAVGIIRLGIMIPDANMWGNVIPPYHWSLARNIPLMIQGIGVALLILSDGVKYKDKFAKRMSLLIFLSYAFYTPVILFVQEIPMLGMLMIPKTLAYVSLEILAFLTLFGDRKKGV